MKTTLQRTLEAGPADEHECPYCDGTALAPSADGRTPCGFCRDGRLVTSAREVGFVRYWRARAEGGT